jgi:hypothetical protein
VALPPEIGRDVGGLRLNCYAEWAHSWLRMQASYDAWHAEWEIDVSRIKRLEPA